jgi:DNA repair protein RadC
VLSAPQHDILRVLKGDSQVADHLAAIRDGMLWALKQPIEERPLLAHDVAVMDYLRLAHGFARTEAVRVLYLDSGNRLLGDEVAAQGTVGEATIYVREIIRRALELRASGLILAHNHPSGIAEPSDSDMQVTHSIAHAGKPLGIRLLDHILVSRRGAFSFRALGHL